jgi:L-iditol 2-dehydrogenase
VVTNLSAVLYSPHDLRIEDRPVVEPGPGQVQVAVDAVGVCGSDVHYYEHGRIGTYVVEAPMVIGHESAGRITAVGDGVAPDRLGTMVALEPGVPCRRCEQCRAGRYNLCPDVQFFATPPVDGSMAQYVVIDADFAVPAPPALDAAAAAMAEPVSVAVWACRRAGVTAGQSVLITGAGPIGLFCGQVAHALGAGPVYITDINEHRLSVAEKVGLRALPAGTGPDADVDVLLECSGSPVALKAGLASVARAGRVVLIGMGGDEVTMDLSRIQNRELWITGAFRYANTYPAALELIGSGRVDVDSVISHRFPLAQADQAMTLAKTDPTSLKAVVEPQR